MKVGILGLGLIGGSLARAYALEGHTVYAIQRNEAMLSFAMLAGAVHGNYYLFKIFMGVKTARFVRESIEHVIDAFDFKRDFFIVFKRNEFSARISVNIKINNSVIHNFQEIEYYPYGTLYRQKSTLLPYIIEKLGQLSLQRY